LKREITVVVNSQLEYWAREFDATVILKDDTFEVQVKNLVSNGEIPIVQIDNNQVEFTFLKTLPSKSIIGWLYSDESLDTTFAQEISQINSLILILRPYHLNSVKARNFIYSAKYLLFNSDNVHTFKNFMKLNLWFIRGIFMSCREKQIMRLLRRTNLKFVNFPLGYTDVFCNSFLSLVTSKNILYRGSLLSIKAPESKIPNSHLVFVGQVGQIVRRVAISAARKSSSSTVIVRDGYGAGDIRGLNVKNNGIEYVKLLFSAKFVLCPPGNISGNSFRIHESVVAKRIPLILSHVPSDPNFVSPIDSILPKNCNQSWNKVITASKLISDATYNNQVKSNLDRFQSEIDSAKNLILKIRQGSITKLL
jgi:hypothetical protein